MEKDKQLKFYCSKILSKFFSSDFLEFLKLFDISFSKKEQYSLSASIEMNERRLTVVASGFKTKNSRSRESAKILNWGLKKFDTIQIIKENEIFTSLDVWIGKKK